MRYIERRDQDDRNYYGIYDTHNFAHAKAALIVHIDLLETVIKALEEHAAKKKMPRWKVGDLTPWELHHG